MRLSRETIGERMLAAEATGADRRGIYAVCSGRQHTHQGYVWRYAS